MWSSDSILLPDCRTSKLYLDSSGGAGAGRERPGPAGRDVEEDDEGDADEEEAAETGRHDTDHHPVCLCLILPLSGDLELRRI